MEHALSIDLEDWYHPQLMQPYLGGLPRTSRVVTATEPLLELLQRHGVEATFFCVGEVLERHPQLVQQIHRLGHEVAFHGMTHQTLWDLGPDAFAAEVETFDRLAREVLGPEVRILGFRAPTFSLDRRTAWALPILRSRGYRYDSSVFPLRGPLYGVRNAPLSAYRVSMEDPGKRDPDSEMIEFPVAVANLGPSRLPVGGGVYLRLLPLWLILVLLRRIGGDRPFVLYLHPWETDTETPRLRMKPPARIVTYHGIHKSLEKLDSLLSRFRFTSMAEILGLRSGNPSTTVQEARC